MSLHLIPIRVHDFYRPTDFKNEQKYRALFWHIQRLMAVPATQVVQLFLRQQGSDMRLAMVKLFQQIYLQQNVTHEFVIGFQTFHLGINLQDLFHQIVRREKIISQVMTFDQLVVPDPKVAL